MLVLSVCDPPSLFSLGQLSLAEIFALVGCYTSYVYSCLPTFQHSLSVPSSGVKKSSWIGFNTDNKPDLVEEGPG